jgi:hypothetical protein
VESAAASMDRSCALAHRSISAKGLLMNQSIRIAGLFVSGDRIAREV